MKKILLAICFASLCFLFGCSQSSAISQSQSSSSDSTSSTGASVSSASSKEMPEHDFGFDEAEYLTKTYGLKNADRLDLISSEQFAWLALNRVRAVAAIVDPEDETSKAMLPYAQEGVNTIGDTAMVYVYEPRRDAEDGDWNKLAKELVQAGVANLEDVAPGKVVQISKQAKDDNGSPAPVKKVVTDPNEVQDAVEAAYTLTCCL